MGRVGHDVSFFRNNKTEILGTLGPRFPDKRLIVDLLTAGADGFPVILAKGDFQILAEFTKALQTHTVRPALISNPEFPEPIGNHN